MKTIIRLFNVQPNRKTYFPALTGLRVVAASLVFLVHFNPFTDTNSFLYHFVNELDFALPLFFVLSGFLISFRYFESSSFKKEWLLKYIQNRVARVYPLYFILTTITFIPILLHTSNLGKELSIYLVNITFLKGFFDTLKFTGIDQGWSLTVEECFYFSAPVIFFLCRKTKLWTIALILYVSGFILVNTIGRLNMHGFFATYKFTFIYTFFGRCMEFFAGVQVAIMYKRNGGKIANRFFKKLNFTLFGSLGILACTFLTMAVRGDAFIGLFTVPGVIINNLLLPIFIGAVIWGMITEVNYLRDLLSTNVFEILGKSSYAFYLIHLGLVHTLFAEYVTENNLIFYIFCQGLSIALFFLIEEPLHDRIKKFRLTKMNSRLSLGEA